MGTESLLHEYLSKTRANQERLESSAVVARIEAVFDELKLPWRRDEDAWEIDSDVGRISAGLDDDEEVLTFSQIINEVPKADKKNGEFYGALLRQNFLTTGACFALFDRDQGQPLLVIVARIAATKLDAEEAALALQSVFELSAVFD